MGFGKSIRKAAKRIGKAHIRLTPYIAPIVGAIAAPFTGGLSMAAGMALAEAAKMKLKHDQAKKVEQQGRRDQRSFSADPAYAFGEARLVPYADPSPMTPETQVEYTSPAPAWAHRNAPVNVLPPTFYRGWSAPSWSIPLAQRAQLAALQHQPVMSGTAQSPARLGGFFPSIYRRF